MALAELRAPEPSASDDLDRKVYGVLGIPVDAIGLRAALDRLRAAAGRGQAFLLSTPNLNFLIQSQVDLSFRESLLNSDLCTADGMPVVWLARLLGAPIRERVSGADIFAALKRTQVSPPLRVFLFGGPDRAAEEACNALNTLRGGISCVGALNPGFGSLDDISTDEIIARINASQADLLIVALGAAKGQSWLMRNAARLQVPVRTHLGAVINFEAGAVQRAPTLLRQNGLEWLWRIKEEPHLWKRYWHDGCSLLQLLAHHGAPLAAQRSLRRRLAGGLALKLEPQQHQVSIELVGSATTTNTPVAVPILREAVATQKPVVLDFARLEALDSRFTGLLLMLRKATKELTIMNPPQNIAKGLSSNGFGFLLEPNAGRPR